jgi:uncharacterized protein YqfA (UPF0365 family)
MPFVTIAALAIVLLFGVVLLWLIPFKLWLSAKFAGAPVSLMEILGMRLRRIPPDHIITPILLAHKTGMNITYEQLVTHYLAADRSADRLSNVVSAMVAAEKAGIGFTWEEVTAIDLAGRDVLQEVQEYAREGQAVDAPAEASA